MLVLNFARSLLQKENTRMHSLQPGAASSAERNKEGLFCHKKKKEGDLSNQSSSETLPDEKDKEEMKETPPEADTEEVDKATSRLYSLPRDLIIGSYKPYYEGTMKNILP